MAFSNGQWIRIPIPDGVSEGQKMRVKTGPDTSSVVRTPPRDQWKVDGNGQNYFSYRVLVIEEEKKAPEPQPEPQSKPQPKPQAVDLEVERELNRTSRYPPFLSFEQFVATPCESIPEGMTAVDVHPYRQIVPTGRKKALLIGINYTGTQCALQGCVNDVYEMRKYLLSNGFTEDSQNMILMTDESHHRGNNVKLPTRANILKGMQWLLQGAVEGDILFFQFSGHGGQQIDELGIEDDGLNETILPLDHKVCGQISDDVIWSTLVRPCPDGVKLIALMDSCHSGTGLDLPYNYNPKKSLWNEDTNPSHSAGDVVQISGCDDNQLSADAQGTNGKAGGAMTKAFVKAMIMKPNATYEGILQAMHDNLKADSFKQTPQLTSSQRFNATEKVFSFTDGIEPNRNSSIGRMVRKRGIVNKKGWMQKVFGC